MRLLLNWAIIDSRWFNVINEPLCVLIPHSILPNIIVKKIFYFLFDDYFCIVVAQLIFSPAV